MVSGILPEVFTKRTVRGFAAPISLTLAFCFAPVMQAKDGCTNQNFVGAFGFYGTGFVIKSPVTTLQGPFARAGRFVSDGNGNLTFSSTASFNGYVFPQDFTGTYTIKPDCTFNTEVFLPDPINLPVKFIGVLSDGGNEIRDLFVDPAGVLVYGTARKQGLGQCANSDLFGTYQFELSGSTLQPTGNRINFAGLGRLVADGEGNAVGTLGSNYAGLSLQEDVSGTYEMQPNCIFQLKYYTAGEGTSAKDGVTLKGIMIDGGTGAYLMVLAPNTATMLGSLKLQ